MSICIRYTRQEDKAREVLNIGFTRIITHLEKYNPEIPFKVWIRKVMINTLINEYKRERKHYENVVYVENYEAYYDYSDLNDLIESSNYDEVLGFIKELPTASQHVFNLYYVDGYKHREIAELIGISEGTSKWHLNFARENLRKKLKDKNAQITI